MIKYTVFLILAFVFTSCSSEKSQSGPSSKVAEPEAPINIPRYETAFQGTESGHVVRVWNLDPGSRGDESCHPFEFQAKISDRSFGEDKLSVSNIYFENKDGTRESIGLYYDIKSLPRAQASWLAQGIQSLTKVGTTVSIQAFSCGNGPVQSLDSIELISRAE